MAAGYAQSSLIMLLSCLPDGMPIRLMHLGLIVMHVVNA